MTIAHWMLIAAVMMPYLSIALAKSAGGKQVFEQDSAVFLELGFIRGLAYLCWSITGHPQVPHGRIYRPTFFTEYPRDARPARSLASGGNVKRLRR